MPNSTVADTHEWFLEMMREHEEFEVETDPVRGVPGAKFRWVVSEGEVELDANGQLEVEVEGLLFAAGPKNGTIGDVTHVSASLTCEGDGLAEADSRTTGRVPLSAAGDAEIEEELGSKGV